MCLKIEPYNAYKKIKGKINVNLKALEYSKENKSKLDQDLLDNQKRIDSTIERLSIIEGEQKQLKTQLRLNTKSTINS